jgi:hypothetical protein
MKIYICRPTLKKKSGLAKTSEVNSYLPSLYLETALLCSFRVLEK